MRGTKVLVAGAGLAGLCAARELAAAGAAVTIFDARARAGGRVHTVTFPDGVTGELGGEFIDDTHDAIRTLAQSFSLELVRVLTSGFTMRFRGNDGQPHVSRDRPWQELTKVVEPLVRRYKVARGSNDAATLREMSTFSLREWLRRSDASPELHSMADALRGFFLADPDDLSVLPLVQQLAESGSPAQTEVSRIVGGNARLVEALVRALPTAPLLGHRLRRISHAPDRVIAHVEDDRGLTQEIEGDAMVVTLPATALSRIDVQPALPEAQWRAITALRYGCATKVLAHSADEVFGNRRARAYGTDTDYGAFWDGSDGQDAPGSLVTFLAGGTASRRLRQRVDAAGSRVLQDLCWLGLAGIPIDGLETMTWEDDPLAGGGYAYFDPGFDPAWRSLLAQRAGRLVFAGEHTSEEWQGYMNGAVETGQRAARELIQNRQ